MDFLRKFFKNRSNRTFFFIVIFLLHSSTICCRSSQVGLFWQFNKFVNLSGRKGMTPFHGTGVGVCFRTPIQQQTRILTLTLSQVVLTGMPPRVSHEEYAYNYHSESRIEYECDLLNFSIAVEELFLWGKANFYFGMGLLIEEFFFFSKERHPYIFDSYVASSYVSSMRIGEIQHDYRGATQLCLGASVPVSKSAFLVCELVYDAYLFSKINTDDNLKQSLLFS